MTGFDDLDDIDIHERLMQELIARLLTGESLDVLCADADLPVLVDDHDEPVAVRTAAGYEEAGVLTLDSGVWVELTDGSALGLTVKISRRPDAETRLRDPGPDRPARPPVRNGRPGRG